MQSVTHCNVYTNHSNYHSNLSGMPSEQAANDCRLLVFMFALWCHCTLLLQRHNDANCAMSIEQVRRTHNKGFLF